VSETHEQEQHEREEQEENAGSSLDQPSGDAG
jgi:hypothetical protein